MFLLRLDSKKPFKSVQVYIPPTTSDDDAFEDFCDELESTLLFKSTYTVMMSGCNAKFGSEGEAGERH